MEIEKGVPLPRRSADRRKWSDLAEKMEPEDSVACDSESDASSLRLALKRHGYVAAVRKVDRKFRVWRVE